MVMYPTAYLLQLKSYYIQVIELQLMRPKSAYKNWKRTFVKLEVTEIDRAESERFFQQGRKCMQQGKQQQALKCYDRALIRNPLNFKAHCNKGTIFKSLNQYEKAKIAYGECLKIKPDDILTLYNFGNLQKYLGNYDEAINKYKKAIQIVQYTRKEQKVSQMYNKIYLNCLINISVSYKIIENLDQAIMWNNRIIQQFPCNEEGYFNKGMCLMKKISSKHSRQYKFMHQQDCVEAQLNFKKCVEINPKNSKAQIQIIQCQFFKQQNQQIQNKCLKDLQELKGKFKNIDDIKIIQNKLELLQWSKSETKNRKNKQNIRIKKHSNNISISPKTSQLASSNTQNFTLRVNSNIKQILQSSPKKSDHQIELQETYDEQDFQLYLNREEYDKALQIADKMSDSFQKTQRLIITKFIKGWQVQDEELYDNALRMFQSQILSKSFQSLKDKISIIGHQTFGFILKSQNLYQKAIKHYHYLIEKSYSSYQQDQLQTPDQNNKVNNFMEQANQCTFQGKLIQQALNFYKNLHAKFPNSTFIKLNRCILILMMNENKVYLEEVQKILQKFTKKDVSKLSIKNQITLQFMIAILSKDKPNQIKILQSLVQQVQQETTDTCKDIQQEFQMRVILRIAQLLLFSCKTSSAYFQHHKTIFKLAISCKNFSFISKFCLQILYLALGNYQFFRKNYSKAFKYFRKINVCNRIIRIKMAYCLANINRQQQTLEFLDKVQQSGTKNIMTQVQRAIYLWAFNQKQIDQLNQILSCQQCLCNPQNKLIYGLHLLQLLIQNFDDQQQSKQVIKSSTIYNFLKNQIEKEKCCRKIENLIQERSKMTIKMITLNYSGVLTSPYEFFQDNDDRLIQISNLFRQIAKQDYPNFDTTFSWDMGSLDTKWKERYSPFNMIQAGVKLQSNKMMNLQQFSEKWDQYRKKTEQSIKKTYFKIKYNMLKQQQYYKKIQTQINNCRSFDHICYRTFMKLIYNVDSQQLKGQIDIDAKKYIQQRKKDFNRPYLKKQLKQRNTIRDLQKIEHSVIFFQESNSDLLDSFRQIKKYYVRTAHGVDSVIIFNLQEMPFSTLGHEYDFEQQNQIFLQKWRKVKDYTSNQQAIKSLNINGDSIFQVYQNILFWNIHATSGQGKNPIQMTQLKALYIQLNELLPQYKVILGGDFNSKFDPTLDESKKLNVNYFPRDPSLPTCNKKRTMMQPQRNKAEKKDQTPKDYFLSKLPVVSQYVCQIDGKQLDLKNLPLLPNKVHPYDHFIVSVHFQLKKKVKSKTRKNQLIMMSLNYSGVLTSPYEYYQNRDQKQIYLSNLFAKEAEVQFKNFNEKDTKFSWQMGTLDTKWKERYSPFNIIQAGVKIVNGKKKMMNQDQFKAEWQKYHNATLQSIKKNYFKIKYKSKSPQQLQKIIQTQIGKCRYFDLICYRTFLKLIYNVQDTKQVDLDATQYINQRTKSFSKPYLNDKLKQQITLQQLQNTDHDVVFLQQANKNLIKSFTRKYYVRHQYGIDSIILLNLQQQFFLGCQYEYNFQEQNKIFLKRLSQAKKITVQKASQLMNVNNDSIFQVYKKHLFWNIHPTSGKENNLIQMNQTKILLLQIQKYFPDYKIILGGDFNSKFDLNIKKQGQQQINFNYFPRDPKIPTCKKMRTMMQPQRNKANKLDESPKDYFVSKLPIIQQKCCQISGKELDLNNLPLLPNKEHPYDHYLLYVKFKIG